MLNLEKITAFAKKAHNNTNCQYDGQDYYVHVEMVETLLDRFGSIFKYKGDYYITRASGSLHDVTEDARINFNEIVRIANIKVARTVLSVTDVPEENRLLRHLMTMGKTVKDYRGIILKMADIHSNGSYSKSTNSLMYKKYVEEYQYRRPIFKKALEWYSEHLRMDIVNDLWDELDEIHGYVVY